MPDGLLNLYPAAIAAVVVRSVLVYVALLIGLRLTGKRELGQMTTFDLLVLLLLSESVQNAMMGSDQSLSGGLVAAGTLLLCNRTVSRLSERFTWLNRSISGTPTLLVHRGKLLQENLHREGVHRDEVMEAIRQSGLEHLSEVKLAVLEVNGSISVIPADPKS